MTFFATFFFVLLRILPAFCLIAWGYFMSRTRFRLSEGASRALVDVVLKGTLPVLVFAEIARSPFSTTALAAVAGASLFVVGGGAVLVTAAFRIVGRDARPYVLPLILMNAGNLGIAVNALQYGTAGRQVAVVFYVATTILALTLGVALVARRAPMREVLRLPIVYAAAAGGILRWIEVRPPAWLAEAAFWATVPALLFLLGHDLARAPRASLRAAGGVVLGRWGLGAALGGVACALLPLPPEAARTVFVEATMPSAVVSFLLARKYDASPEVAAGAVVGTTLASPLTVSLVMTALSRSAANV